MSGRFEQIALWGAAGLVAVSAHVALAAWALQNRAPALPTPPAAIEIAVVCSRGGKCRAATFVNAFSTSGWPIDMMSCPARMVAYEDGSTERTMAPTAVNTAPAARARS